MFNGKELTASEKVAIKRLLDEFHIKISRKEIASQGGVLACAIQQISSQERESIRARYLSEITPEAMSLPKETYGRISSRCPVMEDESEAFGAAIAAHEMMNAVSHALVKLHRANEGRLEKAWNGVAPSDRLLAQQALEKGNFSDADKAELQKMVFRFAVSADPAWDGAVLETTPRLFQDVANYMFFRSLYESVADKYR